MFSVRASFLAAGLACLLSTSAFSAEVRKWTDSTGKNTLEASFVSVTAGKVKLEDKNGRTFEIDVKLLSKADQDYIKGLEDNPFKEAKSSPFMPVEGGSSKSGASSSTRNDQMVVVKVNRNRSKEISIDSAGEWNYHPVGGSDLGFKARNITLPKRENIFEKLTGLAPNLNAKKVAFGYTTGRPGEKPKTRIFLGDLTSGRVNSPEPVPGEYKPMALHDDGEHVLVRSNGFSSTEQDELSIWRIGGAESVIEKQFTAYDDSFQSNNKVTWAEFAANGEFVTCSHSGVIVGWDYDTCQPVFHVKGANNCVPAFSPDRNVLAFYADKQIVLLDVAKRETVGVISIPRDLAFPALAFSPSGARIACGAHQSVLVFDGATGELQRDVPLKLIHIGGKVGFPDEGFVLLGDKYLVDIDDEIPVWTYQATDQSYVERGLTLLAGASAGQAGGIFAVKLPHPEAEKLLAAILTKPDLVAYRAGDPVKLDVSKIPSDRQQSVRDALTAALEKVGSRVSDAALVTVTASIEGPTSRTMRYMHAGEYQVQEYASKVDILYNGERAWGTSGTNVPFMLTIKRGENISTKLQELGAKPNYSLFDSVQFPKLVVKPGQGVNSNQQTLGSSYIDRR